MPIASLKRVFAAIVIIGVNAPMSSMTASAQQVPCAPRSILLDGLHEKHAELPIGLGLSADGNLLEIVAAPFGSWTALITQPNGISCAVLYGTEWQTLKPLSPNIVVPSE